jgi:UDP-MurNAc hydroxylase
VLIDPWLIGSCYWRSWWNYPPVNPDLIKGLTVDAVYITHVHWDHWHGPSLKKFISKDTLIITHDEPNQRSVNDLKKMGYKNVVLLKHGQKYKIGDILITPYQFGLFLNDSSLVVETSDLKLLNANDCKIAGTALRSIINRHGPFDFALRSHSSANDRICYSLEGSEVLYDDKNHYSKAFTLFMDAVKPKYAIPFASNHVHLHKDVYQMNDMINDPFKLERFVVQNGLMRDVELKIMLSGDSWSSENGFEINHANKELFENKAQHIDSYRNSKAETLEKYYNQENRVVVNDRIIKMFQKQIESIPKILRRNFGDYEYKLVLFNDLQEWSYIINPKMAKIISCSKEIENGSVVRIPVKIFFDSVSMNMFHHSSISKRNKYIFQSEEQMKKFEKFQDLLEFVELEVFPLKIKYLIKILGAYVRRWREVLVYFQAYLLKRKGMEIYHIEEEILKST